MGEIPRDPQHLKETIYQIERSQWLYDGSRKFHFWEVCMLPNLKSFKSKCRSHITQEDNWRFEFLISERSLMPLTSRRNESGDSLQSSSPERMCSDMAPCPRSALDGIPSSSERIYLPSLIQRYQGTLHSPLERLDMPSNSQRLYPQNSVMPMDEFPSWVLFTSAAPALALAGSRGKGYRFVVKSS